MPFCYRYVAKIVLVERKDIPYMILISAGNTSLYLRWFIIRAQRPDVGSSDPRGRWLSILRLPDVKPPC